MDPIMLVPLIYGCFFVFFGIWSFVAMVKDKRAAETRQWRTSECKLHLLELLGGWFGSISAQVLVKHKVHKMSYQIPFWIIVAAHFAGYVAVYVFRDQVRDYIQHFQPAETM